MNDTLLRLPRAAVEADGNLPRPSFGDGQAIPS